MKSDKKPEFLITYLCRQCGHDFARSELDKPQCFYCESMSDFCILSKEKITPEVIAKRLKLCTDRTMENLKKAYFSRREGDDEISDEKLIKIMAKAADLRHKIRLLKIKGIKPQGKLWTQFSGTSPRELTKPSRPPKRNAKAD